MRDETIEQFYDVLQNIEFAILSVYENQPDLLDLDVIDALDALIRTYGAEQAARTPPKVRLSDRAERVFEAAARMCAWRLGRATLNGDDAGMAIPPDERNSVSDIVVCLKRLRKSVHLWNEQGGRQGYLDYVAAFIGRVQRRSPAIPRISA
jgi:hypothetical protein